MNGRSDTERLDWEDRRDVPEVVSSRVAYQGKLISMRVDEIALAGGGIAVREVVDHPGAVVIAAVDGQGFVYLVRQYRHAIRQYLLELPAGGLEPSEEPLAAAQRELREEVGLEAQEWTSLGAFCSSPGFANERLHAFLAQGLVSVERQPDDDEDIAVVRYALTDLFAHLEMVEDAKTLATLCLLRRAAQDDPQEATGVLR
jgi:8-oxo-dGTP pyrophosphatase MutT (NUDIX family)